ncbi:MAG: Smr/MutS family protein [Acidobacteria bacterium]|nr:Smr/MutS family protein [Acidobacteriota bacterium]
MAADVLKLLEFEGLLALIGGYISSPLGKTKLAAVAPTTDSGLITARQQRAAEARAYLRASAGSKWEQPRSAAAPGAGKPQSTAPLNFAALADPSRILQKLAIEGTVLEPREIAEVVSFAGHASDIKRALAASSARFPNLAAESERIADFHSLVRDFGGKILPSGELDDHASAELRRIRREIEKQRGTILSSLKAFLRTQQEEAAEQDEIVTIRGDRFVVPVRSSRKTRVAGVVHGASSTGQTVYMEPLETIDLNNELVSLREEEQREIQRILAEMTTRLRQRVAEFAEAAERLGVLELAFGCGRFALEYDCVIPAIHGENARAAESRSRLVLKNARHPLLDALLRGKRLSVVPLSLLLDDENRVLVISGPNTGGKTVALKTVGLLTLMAISGLPVPAEQAEFPLFDRVLADIGDYQSIQESLSTFSAHLMNISSMMELADPDSLILLDELGSATDPEEAGALGVAIIDRFRSAGAYSIASTHHMQVKAYATNTPGVLSAHMGFDEQTLQPTYRLELGSPGKSSGLAIAKRLGLPQDVLDRATQTMSTAHLEVEQFLSRLKQERAAAATLRHDLEEKMAAQDAKEQKWKEEQRHREEKRAAEWEKQLDQLWQNVEQRAEQKLREIASRQPPTARRPHDPAKEAGRVVARLREQTKDELRQTAISHIGEASEAASADRTGSIRDVSVGDRVRLRDVRQFGIVRRRDGDSLEVEIGFLRTKTSLGDIVEVLPSISPKHNMGSPAHSHALGQGREGAGTTKASPSTFDLHMEKTAARPLTEINVIGETADEARNRVDKFLDDAFLAQVQKVRIVHGSGKGILRQALAEMFSTHPHVEKFSPAPQNEGGAGATVVELKV